MAIITFESRSETACFHNPLLEGELDEQTIQVRLDPLTGHQSIFNPALEGKARVIFPYTDEAYLLKMAEETREKCFLCDGRWRKTSPRYPEDLIPEGRMVKGDAVLFPNLFPVSAYHAVVMVGNVHYRPLNDLPAPLLEDAFGVAIEFLRRCSEKDPEVEYFTINVNYLFPAGASVLHPHFQILGSRLPGSHQALLLEKSRAYFEANGSCYWPDLAAEEERLGKRFLGKIAETLWFTAYSPMGANEVTAVWPSRSNFLEWNQGDIRAAAEGVSRVLRGYHGMKHSTFNLSCFGGPFRGACPEFRCMLRIVNRQNAVPDYRTDDYYLQKLLRNEIIINRPEKLAEILRPEFE